MTTITFYHRSRSYNGEFPLVAPHCVRKLAAPGNGCKWVIMARRGNVSAIVWERFCSHNFKTKREALDALQHYLNS